MHNLSPQNPRCISYTRIELCLGRNFFSNGLRPEFCSAPSGNQPIKLAVRRTLWNSNTVRENGINLRMEKVAARLPQEEGNETMAGGKNPEVTCQIHRVREGQASALVRN
jgi:hypothetical protein